MPISERTFVGRAEESERLFEGVERARAGKGGLYLVRGEPGIGKSRICEEVASRAEREGIRVHFGQCWEGGGAPAYWPWVQLLRSLRRDATEATERAIAGHERDLTQILPELREHHGAPSTLEPEQARFQLLDAVASLLVGVAREAPLLLVLEDLHAADPSSLQLLEFVAKQLRVSRVCVVGTYRDAEAELGDAGPTFARLARDARTIPLGPLGKDDVAAYLRIVDSDLAVIDAVYERTEGNPLFVVETARLLARAAASQRRTAASHLIPTTVRSVIRERLAPVSRSCKRTLQAAAAQGRDFRVAIVCHVVEGGAETVAEDIAEATEAALVQPLGEGVHRFSHALVRDVLHQDMGDARRHALHGALARVISELHPRPETPWSELAHHLLEAGPESRDRAVEACDQAALAALTQLAFDDAATWYRRAIDALDQTPGADRRRRAELLVGLGHAELSAGHVEAGHRACRAAADLARVLGEGRLLAEAALTYGTAFRYAAVDPKLVALLEEALEALDPSDSRIRARTMARLAAAQQPAPDPGPPMEMAKEAIAMARRIGDESTLLQTLRSGISALMDLGNAEERIELNREYVALAKQLGSATEELRGNMRLVFDCIELGDVAGAHAAIEACDRISLALGHPHYRWPAVALRAMAAIREARFLDAETLMAEARALAETARDPNASRTLLYQRSRLLALAGRHDELEALLPKLEAIWTDAPASGSIARVFIAAELARVGRDEEAASHVGDNDAENILRLRDSSLAEALARLSVMRTDRETARAVYGELITRKQRYISSGVFGMTWESPVSAVLGALAVVLGEFDAAERHYDEALRAVRSSGARAYEPWLLFEFAEFLSSCGGAGRSSRASALLDEAFEMATELSLETLRARIESARTNPTRSASPTPAPRSMTKGALEMVREGDVWAVSFGDESFRLKDTKGLQILSRLVEEPEREFHVLDLSSPARRTEAADTSDAGEFLDPKARDDYRKRIESLRAEAEEAKRWNDAARAEKAEAELRFLTAELARAVGLGGRGRKASSATERARINVQRRLKDALRRIERQSRLLGRHLERSVRTGTYCAYYPE